MSGAHREVSTEVLVIGADPAGLTAAATLAPRVGGRVLVLERERTAGGIPRHSDHVGYGMRDLRRFVSGPQYARRLVEAAIGAGAVVRTEATVTGWDGPRTVEVTAPQGRLRISSAAIILATGARERPRSARLIPGDRPAGVFTTGQLQNLVHLHGGRPGTRAVVVGSELVSWSAVLTLRESGAQTVLMTTHHRAPESYAAFSVPGRLMLGVRVATRTRIVRVIGKHRVEAVETEDLDSGSRRIIECDIVVFTGDWIPDHELARMAGIDLDPQTLGPLVDTAYRTSSDGVFAIGNLVHPVDTADVAALDGRSVANTVLGRLSRRTEQGDGAIRIRAAEPLRWIAPGLLRPGDPPPTRGRLLAWTDRYVRFPVVTVRQGGVEISRRRLAWPAARGRVFRIPFSVLRNVNHSDGTVIVGLEQAGMDTVRGGPSVLGQLDSFTVEP